MTRRKRTIMEMANETLERMEPDAFCREPYWSASDDELERFAEIVRADERNRTWTQDHWTEYERSIAAVERDACAELVYNSPPSDEYESPLKAVYDAIKARGQA